MSSEKGESRHVYHQGFPLESDSETSVFHKLIGGRWRAILYLTLTVVLTTLPTIFISWPTFFCMVTGLASRNGCRRFVNWGFGVWLHMESYLIEKILSTHIRLFGHSKRFSDRCLIIMNHRCHFDWMFFFPVICRQGDAKKWMAMVKYSGKVFPILGWAMQLRNFMFMTRKWAKDERELKLKLNYLKATNSKYQILMFPEGTDLNPHTIVKSDNFAKENDFPIYDHVLHPKTTGFKYTLKTLRNYKIDTVYDVTVGYPDAIAPTEKELVVDGRVPREIHYHVRSYSASSLPEKDEELDEWIRQRWEEKEERLRLFYSHRKFHEPLSDATSSTSTNGHSTSDASIVANRVLSPEVPGHLQTSEVFGALLFCVVNLFVWGYLCWTYWYIGLLAILLLLGMVYVSVYTEGADYMVLKGLDRESFKIVTDEQ